MHRQIICTVGTSLLTNADRPWGGWRPGQRLPEAIDGDGWLRQADLVRASAEANTLRALGVGETDALVLLHSDTSRGGSAPSGCASSTARDAAKSRWSK